MESAKFDRLTGDVAQRIGRRTLAMGAAAGLLGPLGLSPIAIVEAGKKGKKKKKKKKTKGMCTSAYGKKLRCATRCCDAATSTIAACTDFEFPTCCASSGKAHPLGTKCCSSYYHGIDGVCSGDFPVCCSEIVGGGCCTSAYPVCCVYECCPSWDYCAADGYCGSSFLRQASTDGTRATGKKLRPGDRQLGATDFTPATDGNAV